PTLFRSRWIGGIETFDVEDRSLGKHLLFGFLYSGWRDVVFYVECNLLFPSAIGFINGLLHAFGDLICIEDNQAINISRCATRGLCERFFISQKSFLVGIQNGDQ